MLGDGKDGGAFVRIQIVHEWQPESNPYPEEVEGAFKNLRLPEAGSIPLIEEEKKECIIRHETGPEIILLASSLVSLATGIIQLVQSCRKRRPETRLQVTVRSPEELERVLKLLATK